MFVRIGQLSQLDHGPKGACPHRPVSSTGRDHDPLWWVRPDLAYEDGTLRLAGHDLTVVAAASGTPAYFYSGDRVLANLRRLRGALAGTGLPFVVKYAMKANRFGPLLTWMKASGLCGVD